jgi:hypothetical protein
VYPATGKRRAEGKSTWEDNSFVADGNLTTARVEWFADRIVFTLMNGAKAVGKTGDVIKTATYSAAVLREPDIPQVTMPVGINSWCFQGTPERAQGSSGVEF